MPCEVIRKASAPSRRVTWYQMDNVREEQLRSLMSRFAETEQEERPPADPYGGRESWRTYLRWSFRPQQLVCPRSQTLGAGPCVLLHYSPKICSIFMSGFPSSLVSFGYGAVLELGKSQRYGTVWNLEVPSSWFSPI